MNRVRWTPIARADFIEITDYFADRDPDFPWRLLDQIDALADLLLENPEMGPELEYSAQRKFTLSGTNYVLIYRPMNGDIEILKVRHAARDWRSDT